MKLPFTILSELPLETAEKWQRQFVAANRSKHEGVWRRTQEPTTQQYSHYRSAADGRWKLMHFLDEYALHEHVDGCELVIERPYLWWNTALPGGEMQRYYQKTLTAMSNGGWEIDKRENRLIARLGDMTAVVRFMTREEAERCARRKLPDEYVVLDIEVFGSSLHLSNEERARPWMILESGIRSTLPKGSPRVVTEHNHAEFDLSAYVPFQLELGCGPSIEAGVPPLAYLHGVYAVSNPKTHEYLIGDDDYLPTRFFGDTAQFYRDAPLIYATALEAQPSTVFYQSVQRLFRSGIIVNPVFTNNYDGLVAAIGMTEYYLRQFEDAKLFPKVTFSPQVKALVVVGSHADRRKLQEKARSQGLAVIYVDPEQYIDPEGRPYLYPLESPQNEDTIISMSAEDFSHYFLENL